MKRSLIAALALSGIGVLAASSASAQCVWVSCPNSPPPQYQPQPPQQNTYYQQQREVYRQETRTVETRDFDDGYRAGLQAASRSSNRAVTSSSHKRTKITRSTSSASSRKSAVRSHARSSGTRTATRTHTQYRAPVKRQTASTSVRRSTTSYRAPVRNYNTTSRTSYQTNYVQPYRDNARAYNAQHYGNSVNIANYGGRGESWVSTSTQVVRYSTPHVISNVDGRSCGWGTQIAANGQMTGRQAFVCHCEQGWLPR